LFYREISELEPGHLLEVQQDKMLAKRKEILPIILCPDPALTPESATESLRAELVKAVRRQMAWIGSPELAVPASGEAVSRKGAAVFLSGGVDSSILVALFRKGILEEGDQITTYSLSLPGYDQDEWPYAKQIIDQFRCLAHELPFGPEPMAEAWPRLIGFFKEPLTSTNSISWYLTAGMSPKESHLRIFSGEGADGLFSGGLYKSEIDSIDNGAVVEDQGVIFCQSHVLNPPDLIKGIMETGLKIDERERIWEKAKKRHSDLPVEYAQIAYHLRTTGNRLLTRVERMASAHRVSLLLPYMDNEVVRLILSIPYEVNNRDGIKKYPLKKVGEGLFGKALSFRRKVGFPFPIRGWLRDRQGKGFEELVEMLFEKRTLTRGIYREKVFKKELERRTTGEVKPMDWLLWSAINVELWFRRCVETYDEGADGELS
jgi:asparagine synthase (glutamine-hydrolysing)